MKFLKLLVAASLVLCCSCQKVPDPVVPAFEQHTETLKLSGETITYNMAFTADQKIVEFTVTLDNPTTDFVVRQRCCSEYQVNDKWFDHPNVKCVSRIAGDPANGNKPLPTMSQVL